MKEKTVTSSVVKSRREKSENTAQKTRPSFSPACFCFPTHTTYLSSSTNCILIPLRDSLIFYSPSNAAFHTRNVLFQRIKELQREVSKLRDNKSKLEQEKQVEHHLLISKNEFHHIPNCDYCCIQGQIQKLMKEPSMSPERVKRENSLIVKVPSDLVDRIIDRGGSKNKQLENESGARIKFGKLIKLTHIVNISPMKIKITF